MQKTLISLYGGTQLLPENVDFVHELVDAFLAHQDVVLVSGGFWHWDDDPDIEKMSVDLATLQAVEKWVSGTGEEVESRLKTWLPEIARENVVRYEFGDVERLKGSPWSRRFQLIQRVNAIVTIEGALQTATALELALAIDKPALPIGFTGGDSEQFWKKERDHFTELFDMPWELSLQLDSRPSSGIASQSLAKEIAETVLKKTERRCLVLMDFGEENDGFFEDVLEPAIADAGFIPWRLDHNEQAGNITELFLKRLDECVAIVVDVTGFNANVLYELGHIHCRGEISPLIINRDDLKQDDIPFYLRQHMLIMKDDVQIQQDIKSYLSST